MNYDTITFRASEFAALMTDPQTKADREAGNLSKTSEALCTKVWIRLRYGREKDITSKEMVKGIQVEKDALTLFTRVTGRLVVKNETNANNGFITGTPDIVDADEIIDTKSSWDIFTFHNAKPLSDYEWQMRSYMWLFGKPKATIALCLVNNPPDQIIEAQKRLYYDFNCNEEHPEYIRLSQQVERLMTYDDIPEKERLKLFSIERDEMIECDMQQRVINARKYIQKLDEQWN